LCYKGGAEWHLGEIASCHATLDEAISVAKELKDTHALAVALHFAAYLAHYERNRTKVERLASELIELSTRHHYAQWLALGAFWRGWALSASGNPAEGIARIEQGVSDSRATGTVLWLPYFLGLKAEALHLAGRTTEALETIGEAETLAERIENRYCCAELHRLRAVFLTAIGAEENQIKASFSAAIRTARGQKEI
jgi:predicted ATPase